MKKTLKYLEALKEKYDLKSDNALATLLNTSRQAINNYRHAGNAFDNETALKVAKLLEVEPLEVIAAASFDRAKTEEEKKIWENFYKRLGGIAASFSMIALLAPIFAASHEATLYIM